MPQVSLLQQNNVPSTLTIVSPPGRDSRDSRSSRLEEATEKALGTIALQTGSGVCIWFLSHIYLTFTKSFFNY